MGGADVTLDTAQALQALDRKDYPARAGQRDVALGESNLTTSAARSLAVAGDRGALQLLTRERQGLTKQRSRVSGHACSPRCVATAAITVLAQASWARCPELAGEPFGDLADRSLRPSRLLPQHGRARHSSKSGPWS